MLTVLLLGSLALIANLAIQVIALVIVIRFLLRRLEASDGDPRFMTDVWMLGIVLAMLFLGHLVQFATWALLFVAVGEFADLQTAFYHSVVNFTSLGYGDIVMSPEWRLLGALEAANGILMFGLTTGSLMALMSRLFARHAQGGKALDDHSA